MTSTLSELERKLVELEQELLSVAGGTAPQTPSAPQADSPGSAVTRRGPETAPTAVPNAGDLRSEIDELVAFRDHLQQIASDLVSQYDQLVDRLQRASATDTNASSSTSNRSGS